MGVAWCQPRGQPGALSRSWPGSAAPDRAERNVRHRTEKPTFNNRFEEITVKIKVTSVYVSDQEKALRFYTDVLGFVKKSDFSNGPFRWLTVGSADEPNGVELQLALNTNPPAKAYQQAIFGQGQPAALFNVDDVQNEYDRMKALGADFTMLPTKVTGSTIAMLNDTCGNLIQIVQLDRWQH
jgi:predicted enzyme related to lactoylglutathione lyase